MTSINNPSQHKVVIVGAVRNVAKTIAQEIHKLAGFLQEFKQVQWLLIESDSSDNTRQVLEQLQDSLPNFAYKSLGDLDQSIPERTERIAHCRNAYLEEIETNLIYQDTNLVIMADLDGINNILNQEAIASCFERNDWDGCFANTQGPYYDIWALRHPTWCPTDCLEQYRFLKQHGWGEYAARFTAIYSRMLTIAPDEPWLEVESAFAGFAIYKKHAIKGHRYHAYDNDIAICEHVLFHKSMRETGSKLYINPKLLNCYKPPHTRKLRFPDNLALRLRMLLSAKPF